jgi:hypothetical protein
VLLLVVLVLHVQWDAAQHTMLLLLLWVLLLVVRTLLLLLLLHEATTCLLWLPHRPHGTHALWRRRLLLLLLPQVDHATSWHTS